MVDRELSQIAEREKPDLHPVAYRRGGEWEVSVCIDDEVESTSKEKAHA